MESLLFSSTSHKKVFGSCRKSQDFGEWNGFRRVPPQHSYRACFPQSQTKQTAGRHLLSFWRRLSRVARRGDWDLEQGSVCANEGSGCKEPPLAQLVKGCSLKGSSWNPCAAGLLALRKGWRWEPQGCQNVPAPWSTGFTCAASWSTG